MSADSELKAIQSVGVRPVTAVTAGQFDRYAQSGPGKRAEDEQSKAVSGAALDRAIERANLNLGPDTTLQFRVDDKTERLVVSVVDRSSGEVVRQIPSEEMLAIAERLNESGQGLFDVKI